MASHLTIRRAAASAEEQEYLNAVVDDLTDEPSKLKYAEWLEQKGDLERAGFLRQYADAFRSMNITDFPNLGDAPTEWGRVIGAHLVRALAEQGLSDLRDGLLKLAKPALAYEAEAGNISGFENDKQIPIGGTKLYGQPDLPPGTPWPRQKDSNAFYTEHPEFDSETPGTLACQINFAELQGTQAGRLGPSSGLLSIITCSEIESVGACDAQIVFTEDTSNLERHAPPASLEDDEANYPLDARRLTLSETLEIPFPGSESPFPPLTIGWRDPRSDAMDIVMEEAGINQQINSLFGYTRPTSGDDPLPGAEWCKLICLENSIEMVLHFCIKNQDLAAGNFANVDLAWIDFD